MPAPTTELVNNLYRLYPRKVAPRTAKRAIRSALSRAPYDVILAGVVRYAELAEQWKHSKEWHPAIAYPASWFNADRWDDGADEFAASPDGKCQVFYNPGVCFEYCWRLYEPKWRKCGCRYCLQKIETYIGKYDEYGQPYDTR